MTTSRHWNLIVSLCVGAFTALASYASVQNATGQEQVDGQGWEAVDGWAVTGYAKGRSIAYDWYPTKADAEAAKAKMEAMVVSDETGERFYDRVEIEPERRYVRRRQPQTTSPSEAPSEPLTRKWITVPWVDIPSSKRVPIEQHPASLAGKKGSGKAANASVTFEFQKDGTFVATDPDAGDQVIARGDWSQTGTAVSVRTPTYLYMGIVKGDVVEGKRVKRGAGGDVQRWSISFEKKQTSLVGTTWAMLARTNPNADDPLLQWTDSNATVTFLEDGVMEYRLRDSGYTERTNRRYRVEGQDIYISEGGGYWYKFAIKGDRMFNAEGGKLGNPHLRRLN